VTVVIRGSSVIRSLIILAFLTAPGDLPVRRGRRRWSAAAGVSALGVRVGAHVVHGARPRRRRRPAPAPSVRKCSCVICIRMRVQFHQPPSVYDSLMHSSTSWSRHACIRHTFDLRAVDDDGAGDDDCQGDRRRKHAAAGKKRRAPLGHG
jgi:hypothetical protein